MTCDAVRSTENSSRRSCQENNQIISLFSHKLRSDDCIIDIISSEAREMFSAGSERRKFASIFYLWHVGSERPFMHES